MADERFAITRCTAEDFYEIQGTREEFWDGRDMRHLFQKVDLPLSRDDLAAAPVFHGGPVQIERGFVLHEAVFKDADAASTETVYASTMTIPPSAAPGRSRLHAGSKADSRQPPRAAAPASRS